ncbi:hypothetical protein GCM10010251_68420 [Streptomyces aurantiogriseus]|uniref:Uncharacterized protein n=1 Tax=Streptomyces aurantiogriseus TaxID=66870 RepID=A0A918FJD7_9ACTN|nr:hypothetical protein GCM10010251_68420 [Streptomyces aurantiogriseus]
MRTPFSRAWVTRAAVTAALVAGYGKRADAADLGGAVRRVVVAHGQRGAVRGDGGDECFVPGTDRGAGRCHRAVLGQLLGHHPQLLTARRAHRSALLSESQARQGESCGQRGVLGCQRTERHALGQRLRPHRVVRIQSHQRAFRHWQAGGLDTGTQRQRRLGQPLESLRHAEFALLGPHPGDVSGGDGRGPFCSGLGMAGAAVVRGTCLPAHEQP